MKHYFLNRKPFSYEIKEFDELLKSSDNFVLFQEDIMKTLVYVGFEEDETYGLLKAIAKKKEGIIEPIYERFINGFVAKTGDKDNAEKVWRIIEDAVGYGFNSSHAYSVALDSAYGGWLKAHYPLEYYSTVFNIYENDTEITAKLLRELDYFGIQVKPIKFGMSKATYSYDKETNSIYKGLASIKYLNHQISNELYHLSKNKTYRVVGDKVEYSFLDLLVDIEENTSVNSRQLEILIRLDFFSEFGHKQKLLKLSDIFKNGKIDGFTKDGRPKKIGIHYSKSLSDKSKVQRLENLFKIQDEIMSEENKPYDIYEQIAFEKDVLGSPVFIQPNAKPSFAVVTHVDKKFTPRITLYQLKTGKEVVVKVDKKKFYSDNDEFLYLGDIIEVLETTVKDGWRKTDKGFEKDESKKETFLNKCNLLYRKGEK
jgi:DNA polymerase III alpha subunit